MADKQVNCYQGESLPAKRKITTNTIIIQGNIQYSSHLTLHSGVLFTYACFLQSYLSNQSELVCYMQAILFMLHSIQSLVLHINQFSRVSQITCVWHMYWTFECFTSKLDFMHAAHVYLRPDMLHPHKT